MSTTVLTRVTRYHLMSRVLILGSASTTCSLAWLSPASVTSALLEMGGNPAEMVMTVLALLTIAGWADVVVNDVLPDRWSLPFFAARRYWGYSALGAAYWVSAFGGMTVAPGDPTIWPLIAWYLFVGGCCGWYTFATIARCREAH